MDANKLKKLQDVGFQIQPVCALCHHARFVGDEFGTCGKHKDTSVKTKGPGQELDIHMFGGCGDFTPSSSRISPLKAFQELFHRFLNP